ncbi:HEAT repeat domain-containing protein [Streptomyces niveus]|uniref:HEAT repeat domain-containing protein n=1 Tax=Streptomyces niveus TaxID=193462 RepID=UPI0036E0E9CA
MLAERRVVEVYEPRGGTVGSGYLVAPRLVLTARHVVEAALPADIPLTPPTHRATAAALRSLASDRPRCRVRPLERGGASAFGEAVVVWWSAHYDVALLAAVDRVTPTEYPMGALAWADLSSADPVDVTAVGFPDADVTAEVRESRQIKGIVTPLSGVKNDRWIIQIDGRIGTPPGSGSTWAGMSGAALFADDRVVGILEVDADPQNPERMELWALPARRFAEEQGFTDWVGWTTEGRGAWTRALSDPVGPHRLLRQIVEANQRLAVLDDESAAKIAQALSALQHTAGQGGDARRAVGRVLAMMRSKNVLRVPLDEEIWDGVFHSLRELRNALTDAYTELLATGPDSVRAVIDAMLTVVRNYLGRHETSFALHMSQSPQHGQVHYQFEWPDLPRASLELLALRESLAALIEPLDHFTTSPEAQPSWELTIGHSDRLSIATEETPGWFGGGGYSLLYAFLRQPAGAAAGAPRLSMTVLLTAFGQNLPSVRMAALEEIAQRATQGEEEAGSVVLDLLASPDSTLRHRAQITLPHLPQHLIKPGHVPHLVTLAMRRERHSDHLVPQAALRLLTPFATQTPVAAAFLHAIADGMDFDVAATRQAIGTTPPAATRTLATLLQDEPPHSALRRLFAEPDPVVRRAVLAKLAGHGDPHQDIDDDGNLYVSVIYDFDRGRQQANAPIAGLIAAALADMDPRVRYTAVHTAWACLAPSEATPLLSLALRDQHGAIRARAVYALGLAPMPPLVEAVISALTSDPVPLVRAVATKALGELAESGVALPTAPIAKALEDPERLVQNCAFELVSRLHGNANYNFDDALAARHQRLFGHTRSPERKTLKWPRQGSG